MWARRVLGVGVVALMGSLAAAGPASADGDGPVLKVLLEGLSSPKGLTLSPTADPIVGQGAFGPPGPVLQQETKGHFKGVTLPLTETLGVVDLAQPTDRSGWGLLYSPGRARPRDLPRAPRRVHGLARPPVRHRRVPGR